MINEPVVNDYVIPSEREEDSLVGEPPSVESDTETDNVWEVIEKGTENVKCSSAVTEKNGVYNITNSPLPPTYYGPTNSLPLHRSSMRR